LTKLQPAIQQLIFLANSV